MNEPTTLQGLDAASTWLAGHADCLDRAAAEADTLPDPRVAARIRAFATIVRSASRIAEAGAAETPDRLEA
jgi:hypothetical protein